MLLVFLVVYLFLQSWRAAIIPFPPSRSSLIGTFAGISSCSAIRSTRSRCSAWCSSIGIVVDDAIVVLENVERIMREEQLPPRDAGDQGDARGDRPDHRDRADADRRVRADRVPRRAHRRAVPPVRRDDRDLGRDLRPRGADALAGAVRADAVASHKPPGRFFRCVQPGLRAHHAPLLARRRILDPSRRRRADAVRRDGRDHRRAVADHAGEPRPRRGPGLLHLRGDPARRRDRSSAPTRSSKQVEEQMRAIRRTRTSSRSPASTSSAAASATTPRRSSSPRSLGRAARQDRAALVGELFGTHDGHQGGARARVRSAGDLRPGHRGRLRVLHPEPRRWRREAVAAT